MALNITKGNTRIPFISGTKPSVKNAQLLASTGIPSLDHILGGGLPIGSIFIIEEDTYEVYSKIMVKYFMAEGVITDQSVFIGSLDVKPSQLIREMPSIITEPAKSEPQGSDDPMKIAWRYQNMKVVDPSPGGGQPLGHFYDLTKPMDPSVIENADITEWYDEEWHGKGTIFHNTNYLNLLKSINEAVKAGEFSIFANPAKRKLLRIAIHSLGSKLWFSDKADDTSADIIKFLYYLKAILRNSYAIVTITIPTCNFENLDGVVEQIEHIADVAVKLDAFSQAKMETNPLFKDYHGQLYLKKLAALNTLAPHIPESKDLVFKLRRKKFVIEVLHLPPEVSETTQREQDDIVPASSSGCMSGSQKNLDF